MLQATTAESIPGKKNRVTMQEHCARIAVKRAALQTGIWQKIPTRECVSVKSEISSGCEITIFDHCEISVCTERIIKFAHIRISEYGQITLKKHLHKQVLFW